MLSREQEDDLDAFLWEAEYVSKQVNDLISGKADISKVVEKEKALKEKKEKDERAKLFKIEEKKKAELEKLKRGQPGKGEKDNYVSLCKRCFVEYQIEMPKCWHCNKDTISREKRKDELRGRIEEYKMANKLSRSVGLDFREYKMSSIA